MRFNAIPLFALTLSCAFANAQGQKEMLLNGSAVAQDQVTMVCHVPPGNPANAQTLVVDQAGLAAHVAHGDHPGACHSACDCVPSAVPKTGQTGCWNAFGTPIDCSGTGQDGEYQSGTSVSPRFIDNNDGTVKDNFTRLVWLKDAACLGLRTWTDALLAAKALSSGACGLSDGSIRSRAPCS